MTGENAAAAQGSSLKTHQYQPHLGEAMSNNEA
jgi:hypothetical protein